MPRRRSRGSTAFFRLPSAIAVMTSPTVVYVVVYLQTQRSILIRLYLLPAVPTASSAYCKQIHEVGGVDVVHPASSETSVERFNM